MGGLDVGMMIHWHGLWCKTRNVNDPMQRYLLCHGRVIGGNL